MYIILCNRPRFRRAKFSSELTPENTTRVTTTTTAICANVCCCRMVSQCISSMKYTHTRTPTHLDIVASAHTHSKHHRHNPTPEDCVHTYT